MLRFTRLLETLEGLEARQAFDATAAPLVSNQDLQAGAPGASDLSTVLADYLRNVPPADAAWAVALLLGARLPRLVSGVALRDAVCQRAGLPDWLFERCRRAAGHGLEALACVLPDEPDARHPVCPPALATAVVEHLIPLQTWPAGQRMQQALDACRAWPPAVRLLWMRLVTGAALLPPRRADRWRVGVLRAVAGLLDVETAAVARVLDAMKSDPVTPLSPGAVEAMWRQLCARAGESRSALEPTRYRCGTAPEAAVDRACREPWPLVRSRVDADAPPPGLTPAWVVRWRWGGLRARLVRREAQAVSLWTEDGHWPAALPQPLHQAALNLPPHTVLEGEILADAQTLASITGRAAAALRHCAHPGLGLRFAVADLRCWAGRDAADWTADQRQALLAAQASSVERSAGASALPLRWLAALSVAEVGSGWDLALQEARRRGWAGLQLWPPDAPATDGTRQHWHGDAPPWTFQGVPIRARSIGAQALWLDIGVWDRAPASDAEVDAVVRAIEQRQPPQPGLPQLQVCASVPVPTNRPDTLDWAAWVREQTVQRFGPVRALRPGRVVAVAFDAVDPGPRHRLGLVLRAPRLLSECGHSLLAAADTVTSLRRLRPDAAPGVEVGTEVLRSNADAAGSSPASVRR